MTTTNPPQNPPMPTWPPMPRAMGEAWQNRHAAAAQYTPRSPGESMALQLCMAAHAAAKALATDSFGIPNVVAPAIDAARAYLNFDIGRLDGGTMDAHLCALAAHVGWDLDRDTWAGA